MFTRLRTRLTVLNAGLFGIALLLIVSVVLLRASESDQAMLIAVGLIAVLGMGLIIAGSWAIARSLTKPISLLTEANRQLQRGEAPNLQTAARDEIGRLTSQFNATVCAIGERERQMTHLALHDAETGLPNRFGLERDIERQAARSSGGVLIVAALRIDGFHDVRGAIGYGPAGALVRELAARMAQLEVARSVGRLSTDVMGLVYEAADLSEARVIADGVLQTLDAPLILDGEKIEVSLTLGFCALSVAGVVVESPIDRAVVALDQARTSRRKSAQFDAAAYGDPSANLSLISELRSTIAAGGLKILYQPQYDLRRGAVTGIEALCRWPHPQRGMVPPALFIGLAETTGHIRALTDWMLEQVIADQKAMRAAGRDLTISVNISGRLMGDGAFAAQAVERINAAEARLCFEITEAAIIVDPELRLSIIEQLVDAGVAISIEGYGLGPSSLIHLKRIPATELKIDNSFVSALSVGKRHAMVVKSTIDLAHGLGMKVVAEGVETGASMALLTGMGCDIAQGSLVSRPIPLTELLGYLEDEAARAEGAA